MPCNEHVYMPAYVPLIPLKCKDRIGRRTYTQFEPIHYCYVLLVPQSLLMRFIMCTSFKLAS